MNTKTVEAIKTGWNYHGKLQGDFNAMLDLLEIRRLNFRSKAAWERGNNYGNSDYAAKMDQVCDRCEDKAQKIAKRHGWTIKTYGLWLEVRDSKGQDITIRI